MKIVAIIAVRNDLKYLTEVIPYLSGENIEVILIDNDSNDGTLEYFSGNEFRNIISVEIIPFDGTFNLSKQLDVKAKIANNIEADWIIHQDADEILQSPTGWGGLRYHIELADSLGFNVLNFNELVMLPERPEIDDFINNNSKFYFFEPRPLRLMRAWKRSANLINFHSGGHVLDGGDVVIYPERMLLKHFIVRSQKHAFEKYLGREFSLTDLDKGWHSNRRNFTQDNLVIPKCGPHLHKLDDVKNVPAKLPHSVGVHYWEWPHAVI